MKGDCSCRGHGPVFWVKVEYAKKARPRLFLAAASVALAPTLLSACPYAGNTYRANFSGAARGVLTFDAACTKVTVIHKRVKYEMDMQPTNRGWIAHEPLAYWEFSKSGSSARLVSPEWTMRARMVKVK